MEKQPLQLDLWNEEYLAQLMHSDMARYNISPLDDTTLLEYA